MIRMNIAIADDSAGDRDALSSILKEYAAVNGMDIRIHPFESAQELLEGYWPLRYTVIFLDIYMDGTDGVTAAENIRGKDKDTFMVFLTTSREHYLKAFHTHAFDYIEKPAAPDKIYRVMDDICRKISVPSPCLKLSCGRKELLLPYADIVSVTASAHNIEIVDKDNYVYRQRRSFASVSGELFKDSRFLLIIRGVCVNMDYIQGIEGGAVKIHGKIFPCSLMKQELLIETWKNHIFTTLRNEARERRKHG